MRIVEAFIEALQRLEADGDADAMIGLFAGDAEIRTSSLPPGEEPEPQHFWRAYRESFDGVTTRIRDVIHHGRFAMLEWTSTGQLIDGTPFHYAGVTVLELDEDVIRAMRAYFDPRPLHVSHATHGEPILPMPQGIP